MTAPLRDRCGIGSRELVSIIGAGGKSTILFALGRELAGSSGRVVLTTTTKMAIGQVTEPTCWSDDPPVVEAALVPGRPVFVAVDRIPGKVTGPSPEAVDHLFSETTAHYILVEADGARSMSIKAPADHEPVIPRTSTTVIVVAGIDAIGRPISEVAHRPDLVARIAGIGAIDVLTIEGAASVLLHRNGGLKGIPDAARVVMAITKVTREDEQGANQLATILEHHPRTDMTIILGTSQL